MDTDWNDYDRDDERPSGLVSCASCGREVDYQDSYCWDCDQVLCQSCDRSPRTLLPLSHLPDAHLRPPDTCEGCGAEVLLTSPLCPRCTMISLGLCPDCGRRDPSECTCDNVDDRLFPPTPYPRGI